MLVVDLKLKSVKIDSSCATSSCSSQSGETVFYDDTLCDRHLEFFCTAYPDFGVGFMILYVTSTEDDREILSYFHFFEHPIDTFRESIGTDSDFDSLSLTMLEIEGE
mgnify:CR=1 FL=1